MSLSQKRKMFSEVFSPFPESTYNLQYFETRDQPQRLFLSEIKDCKNRSKLNAQKASCHKTYGEPTC